jgi:hypothetical protein
MLFNSFSFQQTPRPDSSSGKPYNLQLNHSALDILGWVFEFKLVGSWHISRFIRHKDQNRYIYLKLRRMWQAGLLESFKMGTGFVYYFLSKKGLAVLEENNIYHPKQLSKYPKASTLLSTGYFPHESQIVELASMEAMNTTEELGIGFRGEATSQGRNFRSNYTIEAFTPDYTVYYTFNDIHHPVYTEFERTPKSKDAMDKKIDRYLYYLDIDHRKGKTLRFIFQTLAMEESFWLHMFLDDYQTLQRLRIVSTNMSQLKEHNQFLEPIYTTIDSFQINKPNRVEMDLRRREKLFEFL